MGGTGTVLSGSTAVYSQPSPFPRTPSPASQSFKLAMIPLPLSLCVCCSLCLQNTHSGAPQMPILVCLPAPPHFWEESAAPLDGSHRDLAMSQV